MLIHHFQPFPQTRLFNDRHDAGRQLAKRLFIYKNDNPVILGLPRGGTVVAYEVAKKLDVPLYPLIVRKLGAPHNPELAIGAITEGNTVVLDQQAIIESGYTKEDIKYVKEKERHELKQRVELYRKDKPLPNLQNKTVIVIDDGLATGMTALAAIKAIKKQKPKELIFAVPVCAFETARKIKQEIDSIVCLNSPENLEAIGYYYQDFHQVTDEEVLQLL